MKTLPEGLKPLRYLDFDDIILIVYLYKGSSSTRISKLLGLTPPAIVHRLKKIEEAFPGVLIRDKRKPKFTKAGEMFALNCIGVFKLWNIN